MPSTHERTTDRSPLVDVHSHFLPDFYVRAAVAAGTTTPDGMPSWPAWSVEDHLALMDAAGVERSMLSISSPGVHFGDDDTARKLARRVNEFGAGVAADRPDRFGHFAILPLPDVEGAIAEARHALDELGADGVAILSNGAGQYPGATELDPLFDELDDRGALVFVHPTGALDAAAVALERPLPMMEFLFDSARAAIDLVLADRVRRHPRIRWVFTHGGGVLPLLVQRVNLFTLIDQEHPRVDVAGQLARCWFDCAGTPLPTQLPALTTVTAPDHIVYGSDYCFTPAIGVRAQVASLDSGTDDGSWRELVAANTHTLLDQAARDQIGALG